MSDPVSLRLVQSSSFPSGTGSYSYRGSYQIVVENLAYSKQVSVVAKVGGNWQEIPASYVESMPGNLELWTASASNSEDQFAVKYTVLGNTYWDNNAGWNYTFPKAFDEFNAITGRSCPVVLGQASISSGQLTVLAGVQDLAYTKVVGIVYTTDGWATSHTAYGSYYWTMSSGLEVWRVQVDVGTATDVLFAVFYFVSGNEYWDNNFWRNYNVTSTSAYTAKFLVKHRTNEPWTKAGASEPSAVSSPLEIGLVKSDESVERRGRTRATTN